MGTIWNFSFTMKEYFIAVAKLMTLFSSSCYIITLILLKLLILVKWSLGIWEASLVAIKRTHEKNTRSEEGD